MPRRRFRRRYRRRPRRFRRRFRSRRFRRYTGAGQTVKTKFVRFAYNRTATGDNTSDWFATAESFTLTGNVPAAARDPYVNAYDYYSIRKVKCEFYVKPFMATQQNQYIDDDAAVPQQITFYGALDLNDVTPPTSIDYFSSVQNPKIIPALTPRNRIAKFYWRPAINLDSINVAAVQKKSPWIGTDQLDVQHYGIKYGFSFRNPLNEGDRFYYQTKFTLYVKWRSRATLS